MDGQESLNVTSFNGIQVYHCTAGKSEEDWRKEYKGRERQLRKNDEFQSRLTLIHDFSFPGCATSIKVSPDGRYIAAAGTYKPRLKLYECENMSMKVERYSDEEISHIQFLSDDYSKIACSRNDRTVELHSQQGIHTTIKTPRHIRDMTFHAPTCDLFIASNADEVYRYNLEQGSFQTSIYSGFAEENGGITKMGQNPKFPMLSLCGRGGVESWDLRDRTSIGFLDILNTLSDAHLANKALSTTMLGSATSTSTSTLTQANINSILRAISDSKQPFEATCVRFNDDTGMEVAIGLSTGHVLLYDLRSSKPLSIFDHRYDLPIHSIKYHTSSRTLITADKKSCRLWDYTTPGLTPQQRHLTTINAPAPMNDVAIVDDTGMIFMACDSPQMHVYFVPRLGTVPDWAAALENLTEELDQQQQLLLQKQYKILASGINTSQAASSGMGVAHIGTAGDMSEAVFDNSKFITREELEQWGMSHLIRHKGLLTPYMHGFLIKLDMYEQLKEVMIMDGKGDQMGVKYNENFIDGVGGADKIQTELEFIESSIRKEMDKSRDSGFKLDSAARTVNKELASLLLNQEAQQAEKEKKKSRAKLSKEQEEQNKIDSIINDERFKDLFQDEDYNADYNSEEYRRLNPQLKKSALLTTQAFRKVADPNQDLSIRAPTLTDDGDGSYSNNSEFLAAEGIDSTMKKMSTLSTKNYETKGLLDAVGFSKTGNASLEAKGQLTSKEIKEREKANKIAKTKLDAQVIQQSEARSILDREKNLKQQKLSMFVANNSKTTASLVTNSKKMSGISSGVSLSGVKTGAGLADVLSGPGVNAGDKTVNNGSTKAPMKRPMSIADRVRFEEEEKALRERSYISEQLQKRKDEQKVQFEEKEKAREQKRSANPKGKRQKNVY
jgi:ribosome biogenesis protein ENP2